MSNRSMWHLKNQKVQHSCYYPHFCPFHLPSECTPRVTHLPTSKPPPPPDHSLRSRPYPLNQSQPKPPAAPLLYLRRPGVLPHSGNGSLHRTSSSSPLWVCTSQVLPWPWSLLASPPPPLCPPPAESAGAHYQPALLYFLESQGRLCTVCLLCNDLRHNSPETMVS